MGRLFGTDGIRGRANQYPITPEVALSLGKAVVKVLAKKRRRPRIVVGKDTRISCYMLELAVSSGITSMGGDVLLTGPIPTPGIAFLTVSMRCDAGVVISASHNPFYDNGIKFFGEKGFKLDDKIEEEMEVFLPKSSQEGASPEMLGRAKRVEDAVGRYVVFLKSSLPRDFRINGFRLAVDCANGATYKVAPEVYYELGVNPVTTGVSPNGFNINERCGALFPENVARVVMEEGLDMGISFDGDGDRVIMVDRKGRVIDGDRIMAFLASCLKKRGLLRNNTVVCTVMSNMAFEVFLKERGINVVRSRVGDRYVLETMIREGCNLGGEQSGHIVLLDHSTTGDGILTSLQVIRFMEEEGISPEEVYDLYEPFPQVMRNVPVTSKPPIEEVGELKKVIDEARKSLNGRGRVLVRYSGTEPLLRVMVEGEDVEKIERLADRIAEVAQSFLG